MRDTTRAETLLSLFTSSDCAAAIAGDLTEERWHRGSSWFWQHVLRTTLALWRSALAGAPLMVLAYLRFGAGERWSIALVHAATAFALLDVVFRQLIRVPFEPGVVFDLLGVAPGLPSIR